MEFVLYFYIKDALGWYIEDSSLEDTLIQATLEDPDCPEDIADYDIEANIFIDGDQFVVILSDEEVEEEGCVEGRDCCFFLEEE